MKNGDTRRPKKSLSLAEWAVVVGAAGTTLILVLGLYAVLMLAMDSRTNHDQLTVVVKVLAAILRYLEALCRVNLARC